MTLNQPVSTEEMLCPKCALQQPKAEECRGCGVIIARVPQQLDATADAEIVSRVVEPASADEGIAAPAVDEAQAVSANWIFAPLVVAVFGAWLWYFVAVQLDYEFGAIAWLIGAAVGFAALASGARGNTIGVICALFVVASICSGKYMAVSSQQTELAEILSQTLEYKGIDLQEFYQEELIDAREFAKLPGDDTSLRQFIAAHDYSESLNAAQVSNAEVDSFLEFTAPRLQDIAQNQPGFEEWREYSLSDSIKGLSTFNLMIDSPGLVDILFFFLGVGTAFRLASQGK